MKAAIIPGDIVWDIGAHVGLYTNYFLDWVGEAGEVVAFEPLPSAFVALTLAISTRPKNKNNAVLQPLALADYSGEAVFTDDKSDNKINPKTAHLIENPDEGEGIKVKVDTADHVVIEEHLSIPNVVKIDVEGFEESVLLGGEKTFANPACRHLLIEIHFERIDERKLGDSVGRMVKLLKKWGYKVRWVDASHLHASR
ncbi:FkbM family methyltransferase [Mucilaginibacter calamicampi]|uniref:FkbM family methyltransferase n=1 Tax=Mucilaginibacter calamicampi TaxID=1302352 RepID=A0ABW2YXX1_9SPHI